MSDDLRERVLDTLFEFARRPLKPPVRLFALVDAARSEQAFAALEACPHHHEPLPADVTDPELLATLPWLVEVPPDSGWLRETLAWAWGGSTLSFAEAIADFAHVQRHFRAALLIERPPPESLDRLHGVAEWSERHGHPELAASVEAQLDALRPRSLLRAWDPRVLRRLLAKDDLDVEHFGGPILRLHCESERADRLLTWERTGSHFVERANGR